MTAILLAAGVGKRMGPNARPKCLLAVGGRSLLQRTLESLRAIGVHHVVLVVGYAADAVAAEARAQARGMHLTVLENPRYREGAILSLWTARTALTDDVLIMDADVLCPPLFLERLARSSSASALLVDGAAPDSGEEQIVFGQGARVLQITKHPAPELRRAMTAFGESVGFLKLSREAAGRLRQLLEQRVASGDTGIEHEQLYPALFQEVPVGYERVDGFSWIEIDTPGDLARAEREILPQWLPPQCLNRLMAHRWLPWVAARPVTPNQLTALSLGLGLAAVACIAQGGYVWGVLGAALFQGSYLADNWDGEIARLKGLSSPLGGWFDLWVDLIVQVALPLGLAAGLQRMGMDRGVLILGWIAAVGLALDFLVTWWAKARGFGPAVFGDPARGRAVAGESRLARWVRANLTNENLSLLVAAVLVLNLRWPFLAAMAVGAHVFWLQFLWRDRRRLAGL